MPPSVSEILTAWHVDAWVVVPVVLGTTAYLAAARRTSRRYPAAAWPAARTAAFLAGGALLVVALQSPVDVYADSFLWVHMVQHLLLTMVVAPLLLLGAPVTLWLRTSGPTGRRRARRLLQSAGARVLTHPLVAWLLFAAVLVGSHFSPLYQTALEREPVHALEHLLYLGTGLLFWWPAIGLDPSPHRLTAPLRVLYLFAAAPVNTVTALAIYGSKEVLYPHYLLRREVWGPDPLMDQAMAGALMWIVGDLILLVAVGGVLARWMRDERRLGERLDARLSLDATDAQPGTGRTAGPSRDPG
jgi:cytochrome c oxidase assembly factor CtaG